MASSARPKGALPLREFDLIRAIRKQHSHRNASIIQGIGDDAAITALSEDQWQILTTDLLAEGIHFDLRIVTFSDVGFRAGVANLSDIAAMGGIPQYLLVTLAIPRTGTARQVQQLYRGMMASCRPYKVSLVGGDISGSTSGWFLAITLIGTVAQDRALLRSGARVGDDLYVTGTLGDSLAGLELLRRFRSGSASSTLSPHYRQFLVRRHVHPTARVAIGQWLSTKRWASSAIDISDGLSGDLRHICEESRVGAEIDLAALPLSPACRAYARSAGLDPITLALAGGEDYELLFTVPARSRAGFERMTTRQRVPITRIGMIRPARSGLHGILPNGRRQPLRVTSYEHFRSLRGRIS